MIPAGIAASHTAFIAWRAAALPNLERLSDEDAGHAYQALSALLRDVERAHMELRELVIRRIMAVHTPTRLDGPVTPNEGGGSVGS